MNQNKVRDGQGARNQLKTKEKGMTNDTELLNLCRKGDPGALSRLIQKYGEYSENVIRRIVRGDEAVKDVSQETWLRIVRKIGRFQGKCKISTWIYRISVNESCRYLERFGRKDGQGGEDPDQFPSEDPGALNRAIGLEEGDRIRKLVDDLEPAYKSVMTMFYFMDMRLADIARSLKLPVGTVNSRISRGRRILREKMEALALPQ